MKRAGLVFFLILTIFGLVIFVISIIKSDKEVHGLLSQYQAVQKEDSLNSKIQNIVMHRSSALVTLNNDYKIAFKNIFSNPKYEIIYLDDFIKITDTIQKRSTSDTIWVIRNSKRYFFITLYP